MTIYDHAIQFTMPTTAHRSAIIDRMHADQLALLRERCEKKPTYSRLPH